MFEEVIGEIWLIQGRWRKGVIDFADIEKEEIENRRVVAPRILDLLNRPWIYNMNMLRFSEKGKIDVFELWQNKKGQIFVGAAKKLGLFLSCQL